MYVHKLSESTKYPCMYININRYKQNIKKVPRHQENCLSHMSPFEMTLGFETNLAT